jgi:deuterolysin
MFEQIILDLDNLDESAFVNIRAGETVTVSHDVAALYDFESLGLGEYQFKPITTFQVAQDNEINKFKIAASTISVEVASDVARRDIPTPTTRDKRSTVSCSNASQSSFIAAS